MKKIIICATQRCGSTMICEDFRNTGVLGLPEEYFIPWTNNDPNIDWERSIKELINAKNTGNNVFSVKIMANQLKNVEDKINRFSSKEFIEIDKGRSSFHQFFKDALWVRVWREDKLKQAISRVMAQKTDICHATKNVGDDHFAGKLMKGYDEQYNIDIKFDYCLIKSAINEIIKEERIWDSFFKNNGIQSLRIVYEEVVDNNSYLSIIADKLSILLPENNLPRKMFKLSNSVNDVWYEKYNEIYAMETR